LTNPAGLGVMLWYPQCYRDTLRHSFDEVHGEKLRQGTALKDSPFREGDGGRDGGWDGEDGFFFCGLRLPGKIATLMYQVEVTVKFQK
jgi:hypothetical protein